MIKYPEIEQALDRIAELLTVEQKALVNQGGNLQAFRTGNLHRTIDVQVKPFDDQMTSLVTVVPYYGEFVNFGTIKMKARPFIERSLEKVMAQEGNELLSQAGVDTINQMIDKELKEVKIKN